MPEPQVGQWQNQDQGPVGTPGNLQNLCQGATQSGQQVQHPVKVDCKSRLWVTQYQGPGSLARVLDVEKGCLQLNSRN